MLLLPLMPCCCHAAAMLLPSCCCRCQAATAAAATDAVLLQSCWLPPLLRCHRASRRAAATADALLPPSCHRHCQASRRRHCCRAANAPAAATADAALPPSCRRAAAATLPHNYAHTIVPQLGSLHGGEGRTLCHSRWPIGGSRCLPGNGRHSCCQCSNARLLTTIHSCCPCCCGRHSASHNGTADRAPGLAQNAVAACGILVGVGAHAALPFNNLGRRQHCLAGKFVGN